VTADPDDDVYFAAALEGRAAFLVSGDRDLLDVGTYEGVLLVVPREFHREFRGPIPGAGAWHGPAAPRLTASS
jgi:predicted nucleic acid-binding protein